MKNNRFEQLKESIPDAKDKLTGIADGRYGEDGQLYSMAESLSPRTINELEEKGYVVIQPELQEAYATESNKYIHDNYSMILDKVEPGKNPPIEVIAAINSFYNRINPKDKCSQLEEDGSISQVSSEGLKQIYDKIGIQYKETEDGKLNIKSSFDRPTVSKNKFEKIHAQVKGKVKNAFNNLKNFFKGKETDKNLDVR